MRVAHILRKYDPSEWGGTETAVHQLTAGLASHGVRSVAYSPRLAQTEPASNFLAESGCPMRRFRAYMPIWGLSPEKRTQMVAVGGNLLSFELMASLWRERDIDVIHSHVLGRLGAIARAIARRKRIPVVFSIHGGLYDIPAHVRRTFSDSGSTGVDWGKPFGLLLRSRHILNDADAVLTCNPREAELIRQKHPHLRVVINPHGVSAARFAVDHRDEALRAFPQLKGREVLLVLGRIDPVKNQAWLVEQSDELLRRHPRLLICFVGASTDLDYSQALHSKIAAKGLQNSFILAGKLPSEDPRLIGLLQCAQAVVLPSLSETFGLVILEAWASGTPVICSRTSGALSMVEDGKNGCLFSLTDPGEFHRAVNQIMDSPSLRKRMAEEGRQRAVRQYDTTVLAGQMKEMYEELIESKRCVT